MFIFFSKNVTEFEDADTVSKSELISCFVDAKTLEVWGESKGKDLDDIKLILNRQRFGKDGVPNYPGKTEKEPVFGDLFENSKPTVSFSSETGDNE